VKTVVTIDDDSGGKGIVGVTLTLDQGAVEALGGRSSLTAQLKDADLIASGWSVTGPAAGPGSSVVITAVHPYKTLAEASQLVADLAGSGATSKRPFRLALLHRSDFWHVYTGLSGTVDLTCGLGCFGDSGLESSLGSPTGIDPAPLLARAGRTPAQVFTFALDARLPGTVEHSNAASDRDGLLLWTPQLGRAVTLSATAEDWNWENLVPVIAGLGLVAIVIVVAAFGRWRFKRRRSRGGKKAPESGRRARRRGAHARPRRTVVKSVTARS
jgi:hypothetical protein